MGDKEFHQMLGILCDYDDKIHECSEGDRKESLKNLATEMGINLTVDDINDLVKAFDDIIKIKTKNGCYMATPRN